MAKLLLLYKLLIFLIILKENLIISLMLPNLYIRWNYGNHFTNYSSGIDPLKLSPTTRTILCPVEAAQGSYAYPFSNNIYIVCWHHKTSFVTCLHGKVYDIVVGKCIPVAKPQIRHWKKVYLYNCPYNDRQKHFYPYNPRNYIQCCRGQLTVLNCRQWEIFSIQQRRCLPETHILPNDHVPAVYNDKLFCPLNLFGLFPHPFSNEKYLKCVEGRLYEKSCRQGLVYDFMRKLCVENSENLFQILPPFQTNYSTESFIQTQISDNLTFLQCPPGLNGTFVHPFSCFDYIYCSPAGTQVNTCSRGKLYNFREKKCDIQSRLDAYDHAPCAGSNEGKEEEEDSISLGVFCARTGSTNYPHPQSQYKYVNCNNGELQVKRCPRNEIFSLDDLKCIAEPTAMDEEDSDE